MSDEIIVAIIAGLPGFLLGCWSLIAARGKTSAETAKMEAESEDIHAQVADRWAAQVAVLQSQVKALTLDVAQVRRENEQYRDELAERDMAIADLKDWAARLIRQLAVHAPDIEPEKYRHVVGDETLRRLRERATNELQEVKDGNDLYRGERGGAERSLET